MHVTEVRDGVPWDGRTPFERWVEDDLGLPLHRGYFAGGLSRIETRPWSGKGLRAAFLDMTGAESLAGAYVAELPPGESSEPVRQLFDEVIYILSGRGHTSLTTTHETTSFEWGPRSLFTIPLNCLHQFHNASGQEPARFISVNTLPVVFNLFRDAGFLFGGTPWDFHRAPDLSNPGSATLFRPDSSHTRTAVDLYETLFVPDALVVGRSEFVERGGGNSTVYFELGDSIISAHVASFEGGKFFNPHRHGPSAFVFTLQGQGYSLMWPEGSEPMRFDWPEDDVGLVVPPNWWWHGHFVTSPTAIQLAVKLRSRKHPFNHLYDKTHKLVSEGGTVLRYQDLDPVLRQRIWEMYLEACQKAGQTVEEPLAVG